MDNTNLIEHNIRFYSKLIDYKNRYPNSRIDTIIAMINHELEEENKNRQEALRIKNDKMENIINAYRVSCPYWNSCKDRVGFKICSKECENVKKFIKSIDNILL